MSTASKESRAINRAVRVLDEIESRIHELREELEQQGLGGTGRGRRSQRDDANESHAEAADREPHAQGRVKHPEADKRLKGNKNGSDADLDDLEAEEHREPHAQAKAKHPDADKRTKASDPEHDDHGDEADDREPHAQGRVKHPETDKRLKANKE